jgi:hypothetical protein
MYRVDALKRSGIMNPQYFVFWDDIELGAVIRMSGYTIHAISAAKAYHHFEFKGASTTFRHYYLLRNKIYYFTKFLSDAEFLDFPEILTRRVYRIIVCNQGNTPVITACMHALNDGLNGAMGKADDYKIASVPDGKKWHGMLKGKTHILIRFDPSFLGLEELILEIQALCGAHITVVSGGASIPDYRLDRVAVVPDQNPAMDCDMEIFVCYHVLDFQYAAIPFSEGHTLIIDNYGNAAADGGDLLAYRQYENHYGVFKGVLYPYIKEKLCALRESYKRS